jgi:hypothetical protein
MSRTTRCLFAIGLSVSLAAACGDDDDVTPSGGGSGGRAGSAGTGGRAGAAGTAGTGGAAGTTANGGSSAGGTGGGSAGTGGSGGSSAGTGGSVAEPVDAGADAATDAAVVVVSDAGPVELVACEDLDEATATADTTAGNQEVIITRIQFNGNGSADVTFRVVIPQFNFTSPLELCTGSEFNFDCDDVVQDPALGDGGVGILVEGDEVTFTTPGVNPVAGEIALLNGAASDSIVRAYVAWGNFTSVAPLTGGGDSLDTRAADEGVWTDGERVELLGNSVIFANGNVTTAAGFDACTPEG